MAKLAKPTGAKDPRLPIFCWRFSAGGKAVPQRGDRSKGAGIYLQAFSSQSSVSVGQVENQKPTCLSPSWHQGQMGTRLMTKSMDFSSPASLT